MAETIEMWENPRVSLWGPLSGHFSLALEFLEGMGVPTESEQMVNNLLEAPSYQIAEGFSRPVLLKKH